MNWQEEEAADEESILVKHEDDVRNVNQKTPDGLIVRLDAPKSDRSTEYHPLMVPMNHDLNNDIYFIGKRREGVKYNKRMDTIDTLIDIFFPFSHSCRLQRSSDVRSGIDQFNVVQVIYAGYV